jgi:predicted esterase
MRQALAGFIVGVGVMAVVLFFAQRQMARVAAPDLEYDFALYVFSGDEFPFGDLAQGRALRRLLFPVKITRTFYNAQFEEVTRPDKPGRYGAIVRIALNGTVETRYITLYETTRPMVWRDGPLAVNAVLPPGTGIDPVVAQKQMPEIGDTFKDGVSDVLMAKLLAALSETKPEDPPSNSRDNFIARDNAWWFALRQHLGETPSYPRVVDLPGGYEADPARRWPLMLYLHGVGERGEDLGIVRRTGMGKVVAEGRQIPAIVVSPQLSSDQSWSVPELAKMLDDLEAKYRVDTDRVYLLGSSAGGDTVWHLALTFPDRFAALVVMAGECRDDDFARIRDVPAWVIQGSKDDAVDPGACLGVPQAIERVGGHPHVTIIPGCGHDCWDTVLAKDALYTWLLAQKRGQPEVVPAGVGF